MGLWALSWRMKGVSTWPGGDHVASDAVRCVGFGRRLGRQPDYSRLAGPVSRAPASRTSGRKRSHVDDGPTSSAAHGGHSSFDPQKPPSETDGHDSVPHLLGLVIETDTEVGPGVVTQYRQRSERFLGFTTASAQCDGSVTSRETYIALPLALIISDATCLPTVSLMSTTHTDAPSDAKRRACAAAMPLAARVIRAVWLSSLMVFIVLNVFRIYRRATEPSSPVDLSPGLGLWGSPAMPWSSSSIPMPGVSGI